MTAPKLGRPPKPIDERFTHYDFVRMTKQTWGDVGKIARHLGFASNGGRAAAIRHVITKMAALLPKEK